MIEKTCGSKMIVNYRIFKMQQSVLWNMDMMCRIILDKLSRHLFLRCKLFSFLLSSECGKKGKIGHSWPQKGFNE